MTTPLRKFPSPRLLCCLALTVIAFTLIASVPASAVTGAGFTTFDNTLLGCLDNKTGIDCNNYSLKIDVFMNGGPTAGGIAPGNYYFTVLAPGSQNGGFIDGATGNLSSGACGGGTGSPATQPSDRSFTKNSNGTITNTGTHANGTDPQQEPVIQLAPYCDTPNAGGVYILAICTIGATSPSQCKFDAFRVKESIPPPPPGDTGFLKVCKYYDANADGSCDGSTPGTCSTTTGGDALIAWDFQYTDGVSDLLLTDNGECTTVELPVDAYTVQEGVPTQTNWYNTQPGPNPTKLVPGVTVITQPATVVAGDTTEVDFGNYCVGAGGGLTLGYWSNQNGQRTMGCGTPPDATKCTTELTLLANLCLRDGAGNNFNPTTYTQFRTWLLAANATNMSYMLSAQLSAMELNVTNGKVSGSSLVQTGPDPDNCNLPGWSNQLISITDLMADANTELCNDGYTVAAGHDRTCQQFKKNALDAANNNKNFVQGTACPATFNLNPASSTYSFPH